MTRDLAGGSAPGWHLNFLRRPLRVRHDRPLPVNPGFGRPTLGISPGGALRWDFLLSLFQRVPMPMTAGVIALSQRGQ